MAIEIALAILAIVALVASIANLRTDGYRRVPTRSTRDWR
jgi:hypothetical protein